jgi:hypothetical protein
MYTRERIEEVVKECLKYYSFEKKENNTKENFFESIMIELDNSNTIFIGEKKNDKE